MSVRRIAIIGAGPKGAAALQRLALRAADAAAADAPPLQVDVFEPHPFPGAGPVYDPRQPSYLRMNVATHIVDAWERHESDGDDPAHPSLDAWLHNAGIYEPYPPRATVGRYLHESLLQLVDEVSATLPVRIIARAARGIARDDGGWRVLAAGDAGSDANERYDEVLIATGHASDWAGSLVGATRVFPVDEQLDAGRVPPGAVVAIRGCALTFIDAALALTEGRGGSFEPADGHPWRLRYTPSPQQVTELRPWSRSGRLMLAKPRRDLLATMPELARLGSRLRDQIHASPEVVLVATIETGLTAATRTFVSGLGERAPAASSRLIAAARPVDEITRSLDIGHGLAQPTHDWARGQLWRIAYPAIVERLGSRMLAQTQWHRFRQLAATHERLAFGPPPINAAKLVALIDSGIVNASHLSSEDDARRGSDVVVDAVLPPPGAAGLQGGVMRSLMSAGAARVRPGRRGLDILADGTCLDQHGSPSIGLAAIGRPTEDVIIGNDTLDLSLHSVASRWAESVVERAREHAPAVRS